MSSDYDAPVRDAGTAPSAVDSRWWYWIAAAAIFGVLLYLLAFAFGVVAFVTAVGTTSVGPDAGLPLAFGALFLLAVPLLLVGLLLAVVLPFALYLDAQAVASAGVDWEPDPVLYALVAAVGLFAQGVPIQPAVAVYYLYRRHGHVGTP